MEVVLTVSNFRNFVYEYLRWKGENIRNCVKCNILFAPTNNRQKYCNVCNVEVNREKTKENMKINRNV